MLCAGREPHSQPPERWDNPGRARARKQIQSDETGAGGGPREGVAFELGLKAHGKRVRKRQRGPSEPETGRALVSEGTGQAGRGLSRGLERVGHGREVSQSSTPG